MEEIYIIKLKGLPASSQESVRDNKASFYYRKDLTGEALLGFGIMHVLIGATLVVLTIINLIRLDDSSLTILGSGIWCGAIFAVTGLMAVITAHKRKTDISKSKIQVKIFFILSIVTFLLTITYLILVAFDLKEQTSNQYIASNILISFVFELFTSLLSIFTCMRVIWPGSLAFCAKDWPMHQKLKRKIIVSTQIYTNGVKQDEDMIRNLGPNCIISLSPPPNDAIISSDNYSHQNCIECTVCEFCEHNKGDYKSNACHHNHHDLRAHGLTDEELDEQYDSEFDGENFDSTLDNENHYESTHLETQIDINYETNPNDCTQETENKYESIDGNKTWDQNNALNDSTSSENKTNDDKDSEEFSTNLPLNNDSPKNTQNVETNCEESVTEV